MQNVVLPQSHVCPLRLSQSHCLAAYPSTVCQTPEKGPGTLIRLLGSLLASPPGVASPSSAALVPVALSEESNSGLMGPLLKPSACWPLAASC
ncbi:hypothetical protein CapIbe_014345 [Capra ibex]